MINEKYTQLRLARQFGGINTVGFTHTLWASLTDIADRHKSHQSVNLMIYE